MIFNDNIARPYIYSIIYNDTKEYYIGFHESNVKKGIPASKDIGLVYFTSSKKIKAKGFENTTIEIINEFEGPDAGNDAFDSEQALIWHFWDDLLLLNENVRLPNGKKRFKRTDYKKGKENPLYRQSRSKMVREKISLSHKGKKATDETKKKMSASHTGKIKIFSESGMINISNAHKGKKHQVSCIHCNKIVDICNASKWHFDNCLKNPNYSGSRQKGTFNGKTHSTESKRKMSLSHSGKKATPGSFKKGHFPWNIYKN